MDTLTVPIAVVTAALGGVGVPVVQWAVNTIVKHGNEIAELRGSLQTLHKIRKRCSHCGADEDDAV